MLSPLGNLLVTHAQGERIFVGKNEGEEKVELTPKALRVVIFEAEIEACLKLACKICWCICP